MRNDCRYARPPKLQENARGGWGAILSAVEQYEAAVPSCSPNAFLVLGSPGSGKTCLICRLTMDCLDRHRDLVPVLLPVTDLVKRTDEDCDGGRVWGALPKSHIDG